MNPELSTANDYTRPVAYDAEGRPLYAHPPTTDIAQPATSAQAVNNAAPAPIQVVHMSRAVNPIKPEVSPGVQLKHDRSRKHYPTLNLSEGEYIISAIRRHPIGLVGPVAVAVLLISMALSILFNYDLIVELFGLSGSLASPLAATLITLPFVLLVALGAYVAYYVYSNNRFFLTNESVIQEVQVSLFSRREQTVSLANIEDASYVQQGIVQQFFDYGAIRLSTEGDETTYRFTYVANPKRHIATLNNAVEAFKNGRPIGDSDEN